MDAEDKAIGQVAAMLDQLAMLHFYRRVWIYYLIARCREASHASAMFVRS